MTPSVKAAPGPLAVSVAIDNHFNSKVYTTASRVSGRVTIRAQHDVPFGAVDIQFLGTASAHLDTVNHYLTQSSRTFLDLPMPVAEGSLPSPRVFEGGRTYELPFDFVVPSQLTLHACRHRHDGPDVEDRHLQLPPSVNTWLADDLSPDPTVIEYRVRARVSPSPEQKQAGGPSEAAVTINLLPAYPEEAPIHITPADIHYSLSKTKPVRKNFFTSSLGTLSISARQPRAVMLAADGHGRGSSTAHVELEFLPSSASSSTTAKAPEIHSVSGKLLAETWWGGSVQAGLPNMGSRCIEHYPVYSKTMSLFNHRVDKLAWSPAPASTGNYSRGMGRRISDSSSHSSVESLPDLPSSCDESSECGSRKTSCVAQPPQRGGQRATLQVPFSLPAGKKVFLPTFYSCNLSRTYALELTVVTGASKLSSTTLCVPLQVGVEPSAAALEQAGGLPSFESVLRGEFVSAGVEAPLPSYDDPVHRFR